MFVVDTVSCGTSVIVLVAILGTRCATEAASSTMTIDVSRWLLVYRLFQQQNTEARKKQDSEGS